MYDLANQSFTLLITTIFYAIFFRNVVVGDPDRGTALWGYAFGITSVIIVVLSPLAGAVADYSGRKKAFLVALGVACVLLTCALALTGPGTVVLAMTLYVLANICYMIGDNFVAAFLPDVSTRENLGRVSAIGWTMGYVGALLCLPFGAAIMWLLGGTQSLAANRAVFVFAGVWYLLAMIPTIVILKERPAPPRHGRKTSLAAVGFVRVWETARELRTFRRLAAFLAVFLVYSCGVQTFIVFAGTLAEQYVQGAAALALYWGLAAVSGIAAFAAGSIQDRLGHRAMVCLCLLIWFATTLGAAALPVNATPGAPPPWFLWPVGIGIGVGLGALGTASRAVVGVMTPASKTGEFFGMWGLSLKGAGAIGPPLYGLIAGSAGQRTALLCIAGFFALGLLGMAWVNPDEGRRAAEDYEARTRAA